MIASNDNEKIKKIHNNELSPTLEVDPYEVFDHDEFLQLVKYECDFYNFKPKNVQEVTNYLVELCELLNYSIPEFCSYKNIFWDNTSEIPYYSFQNHNWNQIREIFIIKRSKEVTDSEQKFQTENLNLPGHLEDYYQAMKLLLTYEEMKKMDEETKVKKKK